MTSTRVPQAIARIFIPNRPLSRPACFKISTKAQRSGLSHSFTDDHHAPDAPTSSSYSFSSSSARHYSSTVKTRAKNRIYDPVRHPSTLSTYALLTTSSATPLLTLWSTSWAPSYRAISPLLRTLIASDGIGEAEGGVAFCEIELDAPDVRDADLGLQYMIASVPMLVALDTQAGEVVEGSRVGDVRLMADREWLVGWIRREAARRQPGGGGGGGGGGAGLFGGLFGGRG